MTKRIISVSNTPKLPLSHGIKAGDFIFVSGQVGYKNLKTGAEVRGLEAQTRQCLDNVKEVLEAAGSSLKDVVKVNVYLRNADDFTRMNAVYESYFTKDHPTRCTVVSGLANPNMLIEIECIAYCP